MLARKSVCVIFFGLMSSTSAMAIYEPSEGGSIKIIMDMTTGKTATYPCTKRLLFTDSHIGKDVLMCDIDIKNGFADSDEANIRVTLKPSQQSRSLLIARPTSKSESSPIRANFTNVCW